MAGSTTSLTRMAGQTLSGMAMGYFQSRVLCAAARLGVADALGDAERTVDELAGACGADPSALHRLLRALASMGVVAETAPGRFVLTPFGGPLRRDAPDSEWAGVVFWADLLADSWSYLTDCVKSGRPARDVRPPEIPSRWAQDPNATAIFTEVMGTGPAADYMPVVNAWDFSRASVVADVGGGGGGLLAAILTTHPHLRGMLVDRPEAIENAASRFEEDGLAGRCKSMPADLREEVPSGADVYIMQYVLHGYDDAGAVQILRNCRAALPSHGFLLVSEIVLPDVVDRADANLEEQLMSDLNMLAVTGGRERSAVDWKRLLMDAGLECQRVIPVSGEYVSLIEATGPRG